MAIRVYSDKTQQFYNTVEEANRAEFELKEQENREKIRKEREAAEAKAKKEKEVAERKVAADKVEAAHKAMVEAQKVYRDELNKFIETYGSFHMTWNSNDVKSLEDLFKAFDVFNLFV